MRLRDVRIRNYRSIESQDFSLGELTVLFGKNDAGKSNVVKALEFAFDRSRQVDVSNVHISSLHPDPKETTIVVDVQFVGDKDEDFQWPLAFGVNAFNIGANGDMALSFRTEATYNSETRTFEKVRHIITNWQDEVIDTHSLPSGLLDSIDFILLDAHRDLAEVIRDRYSRWNQEMRKADISDEDAEEIEGKLAELGESIVKASPFLTAAENDLKGATDRRASKIEIAPVARNLNELYRSLDVLVTEDSGPSISVALFGAGTRSRAEFMALKALIDIAKTDVESRGTPYYCLAVFEEPEAHIHPQSQQQLLMELEKLGSQRVVTTHSPYLLAKSPMDALMHVKREKHTTQLTPMDIDLTDEQKKETERYLLRTHGELLFADAVVFAEGETEEQALPVFFERYYGKKPFELGVTIVSVASHKYEPFLRIASRLELPWYILSDAEPNVLQSVGKQISRAVNNGASTDLSKVSQVVTCREGNDFEKDLIDDGYTEEIITAIDNYEALLKEEGATEIPSYFDNWMNKTQGNTKRTYRTNRICQTCHQNIFEREQYDFLGKDGRRTALIEFLNIPKNKVRYASAIADSIVGLSDEERVIPTCVKKLFMQLDAALHN